MDAYPLPKIKRLINPKAKNKYFIHRDKLDTYYQVLINIHECNLTAFEACNCFDRLTETPMVATGGIAVFLRFMNNLIEERRFKLTSSYLYDIHQLGKDSGKIQWLLTVVPEGCG